MLMAPGYLRVARKSERAMNSSLGISTLVPLGESAKYFPSDSVPGLPGTLATSRAHPLEFSLGVRLWAAFALRNLVSGIGTPCPHIGFCIEVVLRLWSRLA